MIKRLPVQTYKEILICDKCGNAMEWTGETLYSYPAQYPHYCQCGHKENVRGHTYPNIQYEEIDE